MAATTVAPLIRSRPGARPSPPAVPDMEAAAHAAREFLEALGVACEGPGMAQSPARMAEAYAELLTAKDFELTTFANDEGYDEMAVVKSIPVQSVCEHHLLPLLGVAHVGHLPDERILGLSKVAWVVEMFARRPIREDPSARAEFFAALGR